MTPLGFPKGVIRFSLGPRRAGAIANDDITGERCCNGCERLVEEHVMAFGMAMSFLEPAWRN